MMPWGWWKQAQQPPPADSFASAVAQASQLLLYAIEKGKEIKPEIRDAILGAEAQMAAGWAFSPQEKGEFLVAYAQFAVLLAPVTATTLRASDKRYGRLGWWSRLLPIGPVAEAQIQSTGFGVLALVILLFIGMGEWTRTFITAVTEMQRGLEQILDDQRSVALGLKVAERQLAAVEALPQQQTREGLKDPILKQQDELTARREALTTRQDNLENKINAAYQTLDRWIPFVKPGDLRNVIMPLSTMIGAFILPILYGALGACAYILRTIYAKMVERSFEPWRFGEFVTRVFLGMLSGMGLQWLFVGEGKQIPGGVTPAFLAFVGGYSVELLFTAIDRVLVAAREAIRPSPQPAPVAPPPAAPQPAPAPPAQPGGAAAPAQPAVPAGPAAAPAPAVAPAHGAGPAAGQEAQVPGR